MATNFFRLNTIATGTFPSAMGLADLNGDGIQDLVVANAVNNVSIFLGNGVGGFTSFRTYVTGASPNGIDFGDVNGDGRVDIFVSNALSGKVTTLIVTPTRKCPL
jgi:hypothetical protein